MVNIHPPASSSGNLSLNWHALFTCSLKTSGLSANIWWPAPVITYQDLNKVLVPEKIVRAIFLDGSGHQLTCVFTKLDWRAAFTRSHDDLSIHDREPYSNVIGLSSRNSWIRLSIGFFAQPKPDIMAWNALSPLKRPINFRLFVNLLNNFCFFLNFKDHK